MPDRVSWLHGDVRKLMNSLQRGGGLSCRPARILLFVVFCKRLHINTLADHESWFRILKLLL